MRIDMTDEQAKVVGQLADPYLKENNGIIVAITVGDVTDQVVRRVIHPDGNYHVETLDSQGDQQLGWITTYSTLGRDVRYGSWIETGTLYAQYYDRLTINELIEHLLGIPEDQRYLPIYAFDERTGDNVPLMAPTLFDEDAEHSMDNPLSMTLDPRR